MGTEKLDVWSLIADGRFEQACEEADAEYKKPKPVVGAPILMSGKMQTRAPASLLLLTFSLLFGCGRYHGLEKVKQRYHAEKEVLEKLKASFADPRNEISTIGLGNYDRGIAIRTVGGKFYSLEKFLAVSVDTSFALGQVAMFKKLRIRHVAGYKTGVSISFRDVGRCLVLVGSDSIDLNDELSKRKIQNYWDGAKTNWYYVIDKGWFVRTDCD
jgi:hypothetical protein